MRTGQGSVFPVLLSIAASTAAALAAPAAAPPVSGLSHVAFYVTSLDKARPFYADLLGYPMTESAPAAGPRSATVWINQRQWIRLIEGPGEGAGQLHHVALAADVGSVRPLVDDQPAWRPDDGDAMGVLDPDGHRLGFVDGRVLAAPRSGGAPISSRALHAGILAGDLDAAAGFYSGRLGFAEFWRGAAATSSTLSWVNLQVPGGTDYLELMLYERLPAPGNRGSAHHLCLEVQDMDAALAVLEPRAKRLAYDRPLAIRTGINRKRQLNLFDPDGTRVELMEPFTVDGGRPAPSSTLPPPGSSGRGGR